MTHIACVKKKCLNNCKGTCKANDIYYDGRCQGYITCSKAMKANVDSLHRRRGKLVRNRNEVVK